MEGALVCDKLKMTINDIFVGGRNKYHPQKVNPAQQHLDAKEFESPNEFPNDQSHGASEVSTPATTTKQTGKEERSPTRRTAIR
mmetsp:Transcript_33344/g.68260  ORF Transcript_33344/g.68260 Transcript_33344/m.68260 type:complete len:84 (-) Transcript_33344:252-503(-)